jgi:hypothetical protein
MRAYTPGEGLGEGRVERVLVVPHRQLVVLLGVRQQCHLGDRESGMAGAFRP